VVAACDIDSNHLQAAIKMVNDAYGTEDCKGYHDYKELLARDDIDAVMIAVPIIGMKLSRQKPRAARRISTPKSPSRTPSPSSSRLFARPAEPDYLADGLMAALGSNVSQGGRDCPQRADWHGDPRGSRLARRQCRL